MSNQELFVELHLHSDRNENFRALVLSFQRKKNAVTTYFNVVHHYLSVSQNLPFPIRIQQRFHTKLCTLCYKN